MRCPLTTVTGRWTSWSPTGDWLMPEAECGAERVTHRPSCFLAHSITALGIGDNNAHARTMSATRCCRCACTTSPPPIDQRGAIHASQPDRPIPEFAFAYVSPHSFAQSAVHCDGDCRFHCDFCGL